MARVIGFGSALLDQLIHVPEAFVAHLPGAKGGMELIDEVQCSALLSGLPHVPSLAPGGSAANTVVALARLGIPARLLAKIGADEAGIAYRRHVLDAGVDGDAFKVTDMLPTGTCISMITPDSERTMRTFLGAAATLGLDDVSPRDFRECTHLHVEGYMLFNRELMLHVLELARAANCRICLDLASPEVVHASLDVLPDLLRRYAYIVYANDAEASALTGCADPGDALRAIAQTCEIAVVKLGEHGALIKTPGEDVVRVPAESVNAVDTTGAGDLWAAGFLYGYLQGFSLEAAGRIGAAVAAEVVQLNGAALPLETWARLKVRINALADA